MNVNPLTPGFYSPSNQLLLAAVRRDRERLADDWQDEASAHALSKDPTRAHHIESWIARIA